MDKVMQAMVFKDFNTFRLEEVPAPQISQPDELILDVLACGICGTDINLAAAPSSYGPMDGRIFGHELVADVRLIGSAVTRFKPGDRVVVNPNTYCCTCEMCRRGRTNHCQNMTLMGITQQGGFARQVKTVKRMTFKIKREVPLAEAVFAEPLACVCNGFNKINIKPGDTMLQIGCGPIGMLFAQLGRLNGARVICVENSEKRRQFAQKLGFIALSPHDEDLKQTLISTWGRLADVCIDAAGGQLAMAVDLAEHGGTVLVFAYAGVAAGAGIRPLGSKELTIKGSFIIKNSMGQAISLIEEGLLDLKSLVTDVLPLSDLARGIDLARRQNAMKVVLKVE